MPWAVPPVKYKGSYKPRKQPLSTGGHRFPNGKQRNPLKPGLPRIASENHYYQLAHIQKYGPNIPSAWPRKLATGHSPLSHEKSDH